MPQCLESEIKKKFTLEVKKRIIKNSSPTMEKWSGGLWRKYSSQ